MDFNTTDLSTLSAIIHQDNHENINEPCYEITHIFAYVLVGQLAGSKEINNNISKSNRKAMNRNWSNQKANPALKTKTGNK